MNLLALALALLSAPQEGFADPAPPTVLPLKLAGPRQAEDFEERTFHRAPRALSEAAVVEDSPGFLGPRRDARSLERPLLRDWGETGPGLVWEMSCGQGYAAPAAAAGRLVFTHWQDDQVHIDCLEAETGLRHWRFSYPSSYRGEYIQDRGPRATPNIHEGQVLVHGVEGMLHCLDLDSGALRWRRDLQEEFELPESYFGVVSSPLVHGDRLLLNLGAKGPTVAAFDIASGRMVWGAGDTWGASCCSPVVAAVGDRELLFVLTGGKSRPPTGGLMVLDPASGELLSTQAFRSRTELSVSGATPVVADGRVILSSSYGVGTAAFEVAPDGQTTPGWRQRSPALQFPTPVMHEGALYCIAGSSRVGALVALDPATGDELHSTELVWDESVERNGAPSSVTMSVGEGSLLSVDGALLALGDQGHLLWLDVDPEGAEVRARHWMFRAKESWTPPVVHRGLLYLRQCSVEQFGTPRAGRRLLCYDLRGEGSSPDRPEGDQAPR